MPDRRFPNRPAPSPLGRALVLIGRKHPEYHTFIVDVDLRAPSWQPAGTHPAILDDDLKRKQRIEQSLADGENI